jgi:rhomboid protease GluP
MVHDDDLAEAEVLPPSGVPMEAQAARRSRSRWLAAPATYLLVGINCAVFLWMLSRGVSPMNPTVDQLMHFGADNAGNVLVGGEWARIVTAMFVHVGFLHLATNMWCLWNLGLLAEPLIGSMGVLAVYLLTGAAGNLLSTLVNWLSWHTDFVSLHNLGVFPAGAGASGAVFGIAGALIVLLKSDRLPVPPIELKKLRRSVIYFAAINLGIGITISVGNLALHSGLNIDNWAHVGGFSCGLLFAAPLVPRLGSPRRLFNFRLRAAIAMVVGILVLFGFYLAQLPREVTGG